MSSQNIDINLQKPDLHKKKSYIVPMLPYPSGELHMGHARNYTISDAIARYHRLKGYKVLHPIGWDSFGLPAENAATESGCHPAEWIKKNIAIMREQICGMNLLFDEKHEIATSSEKYYGKQQELFIALYNAGYLFTRESWVNWDPVDKTVLANEQIINGVCWRSGAKAEKRRLKQWFFDMKSMAPDLLSAIDELNEWPQAVKNAQKSWIGMHQMYAANFIIKSTALHDANNTQCPLPSIEISTTKPETIFGVSAIMVSYDHQIALGRLSNAEISAMCFNKDEKIGKKIDNIHAIHPITGQALPIFITNYVLPNIGSGALMVCPAHDERDNEFAKKYHLDIIRVIDDKGIIINSDILNGLQAQDARQKLCDMQIFEQKTYYQLQDWCISRQRYWGMPIPIKYCSTCGPQAVKEMPHKLPEKYTGFDSLKTNQEWQKTKCQCGQEAIFDTDTADTFFDSSWYFMRYANPESTKPVPDEANYWCPLDIYIGGIEHAALHLIYTRAMTRALYRIGYIKFQEPIKKLIVQGMITAMSYKDQDGNWIKSTDITHNKQDGKHYDNHGKQVIPQSVEKMSKSKKNGLSPQYIVNKHGIDATRWFMLSHPIENNFEWNDNGVLGGVKFINKCIEISKMQGNIFDNNYKQWYAFGKSATHNMQNYNFHLVIADLYILLNYLKNLPKEHVHIHAGLYLMAHFIHPMMPDLAEKITYMPLNWDKIMQLISHAPQETSYITLLAGNKFISKIPYIDTIFINQSIELDQDIQLNIAKKLKIDNFSLAKPLFNKKNKIINFISVSKI